MDPEQLAAKLRNLAAPFTSGQLVTLALTFVLVIGVVIASAMWLQKPTYRLLQTDLDPESMAQVVTRLKSLKVLRTGSSQVTDAGRTAIANAIAGLSVDPQ